MADDVTITANANATPPAGTVFAADDISSVYYPRVKITLGADGAADTDLDSGQQTSANSLPVVLPSDQNVPTQPFDAMLEGGLTEMIGINEQVDQNEYAASIGVALAGTYSGTVLSIGFYTTVDGTGAVLTPAGILLILDADPASAAGDAALAAAEIVTILGRVDVAAADWHSDTAGGVVVKEVSIPFHSLATLYFVWFHSDATSFNDVAGDDEQMEFNFWYRRES